MHIPRLCSSSPLTSHPHTEAISAGLSAGPRPHRGLIPGLSHAHLQAPDALTLLGNILYCLTHQSDEHVEEEDKGEDHVGDKQEQEEDRVLGVLLDIQVAQANG